ncbi:MAG: ribonuclease HII, partial [Bacteroidota bacterium]
LAEAMSWCVGIISAPRIDQVNILNATYEAMHEAVRGLTLSPEFLLIDGNRFRPYPEIKHACIIKGDGKYLSIAAASILAKTYRDEIMGFLGVEYPEFGWVQNKGYPTKNHREVLKARGATPYHRQSFGPVNQLSLFS